MSLNKLILNKKKPWLDARVNDLTVDGDFNITDNSIDISSLNTNGLTNSRYVYTNSSGGITTKAIQLPDLQDIASGAPPGTTYLQHDGLGNVSFEPVSAGSPERTISVAQSGGDFDNLTDAVTEANSLIPVQSNPVTILVYPGEYANPTILTPDGYISIIGVGGYDSVRILGQARLSNNSLIENVTFANEGEALQIQDNNVIVRNCRFDLISSTCINIFNGVLPYLIDGCTFFSNCNLGVFMTTATGIIQNCIFQNANGLESFSSSNVDIQNCTFDRNSNVGIVFRSAGRSYVTNCNFDRPEIGIDIVSGLQKVLINDCYFKEETGGNTTTWNIRADANGHTIRINNTTLNKNKLSIFNSNIIDGSIFSYDDIDPGLNIYSELQVGRPLRPQKTILGGGEATRRQMDGIVFAQGEANGSTSTIFNFNQVTDFNDGIDTPLFALNQNAQILLIGSIKFPFSAFRMNITSSLGVQVTNADVRIEYWDGSNFVLCDKLLTELREPYLPVDYRNLFLQDDYNIRLGDTSIESDGSKRNNKLSPVLLTIGGITAYWIRFRILGPLVEIPTSDDIRVHPEGSINFYSNGYTEYFGTSQPRRSINIPIRLAESVNSTPNNEDVYIGESLSGYNIGFKGIDNAFPTATDRFLSFPLSLPNDIDTSKGLVIELRYFGDTANTGFLEFDFAGSYVRDIADGVSTLNNITTTPNINTDNVLFGRTDFIEFDSANANKLQSLNIPVGIEEVLAARNRDNGGTGSGLGDFIIVNFGRLGTSPSDSYTGKIICVSIRLIYTAYNNGVDF